MRRETPGCCSSEGCGAPGCRADGCRPLASASQPSDLQALALQAREYETWRIARCMLRGLPADRLDERRERLAEPALVGALAPAGVHGEP